VTFKSQFFTYAIYSSRFPSPPAVGITFKPTPSLSLAELHKLITDLQRVHEYMKQGETLEDHKDTLG